MAMASRIENTPACIEMRAPHTTREKPSRPRSSVPNGCAHDGALRILLQSVRTGSVVAMNGAPTAMSTKSRTSAAPTSAAGRRRPTRHARCSSPDRGAAVSAGSGSGYAGVAALPATGGAPDADARVEHGIGDVDQQVDQDVGRGREEHHALHDGIVAREH